MTNLSPRCLPPEVFASINASSMIGSEKTVSSRPVPFGYSVRVNGLSTSSQIVVCQNDEVLLHCFYQICCKSGRLVFTGLIDSTRLELTGVLLSIALTCVGVVGSVVRLIKCLVYELSASVQCEQKLLGLEDFSGSSIGVDEVVYLKRNYIEISVTRLTLGMGNSNLFLTRMDVLRSWVEDERIPQSPARRYPVHLEFMLPEVLMCYSHLSRATACAGPYLYCTWTFTLDTLYADSNLEEDEEDPKEDPEEDPTDYPADGGDDDDDDDESSDDDKDDDDYVEEEEDEEEEHPTPADSVPPPIHRVTARMSIRDEPPTPFWSEAETSRLLAIPLPPPSPLYPLSSPLSQIPSP
ncbi:hypothetical protein Tco_1533956 [Tanacetum coccineum]